MVAAIGRKPFTTTQETEPSNTTGGSCNNTQPLKFVNFLLAQINSSPELNPISLREIARSLLGSAFFGKEDWEAYFGEVGKELSLPNNIEEILMSDDPYGNGKVCQNYLLVWAPETVNGKPLDLDLTQSLLEQPKQGHKSQYRHYAPEGYEQLKINSGWILVRKEVMSGSLGKTYQEQLELVKGSCQASNLLEVALGIITHYVKTGERLFENVYTRCQVDKNLPEEWRTIGGFIPQGLFANRVIGRPGPNLAGLTVCYRL
jgi:hypothetical protein